MSRSLLSPARLRPADRRTGSAALAAALAVAADRWLPLVEYRAESRWSAPLPRDVAVDVLDPGWEAAWRARSTLWMVRGPAGEPMPEP